MKKIFALFLVVCALPALVGCFGGSNDSISGFNSNPVNAEVSFVDEGDEAGSYEIFVAMPNLVKDSESKIQIFDKNDKELENTLKNGTDFNVVPTEDEGKEGTGVFINKAGQAKLEAMGAAYAKVTVVDENGTKHVVIAKVPSSK